MFLITESQNLEDYLEETAVIDYDEDSIQALAAELSQGVVGEIALVKKVYEYVRDEIAHSADIKATVITCKATEVLQERHGICYAKSHLLAALLRCLEIPVGFCYQRIILDDVTKPWLIVHGLNAVYLRELSKWIRLDARGNKPGVQAEFSVESEKLAFPVRETHGEVDIPIIFVNPDENVVKALKVFDNFEDLYNGLPKKLKQSNYIL